MSDLTRHLVAAAACVPVCFAIACVVELLRRALEGLRKADPDTAVTFDEAVVLGQNGGRRIKGQSQSDNIRLTESAGTGANYTIARLRRDNPDLAHQVVELH